MNALEIRKQLLIAESEVLRARVYEDICIIRAGAQALNRQIKSGCTIASTVALAVAGFTAIKRAKGNKGNGAHEGKTSMLARLFSGARLATGVWSALRSRSQ